MSEPKELDKVPEFVKQLKKIGTNGMNILPPDEEEIQKALTNLKNRKAANDVPSELLKVAAETMYS